MKKRIIFSKKNSEPEIVFEDAFTQTLYNGNLFFSIEKTYDLNRLKFNVDVFFSKQVVKNRKCDDCGHPINGIGYIPNMQMILKDDIKDSTFSEVDFILCEKCFSE